MIVNDWSLVVQLRTRPPFGIGPGRPRSKPGLGAEPLRRRRTILSHNLRQSTREGRDRAVPGMMTIFNIHMTSRHKLGNVNT